jgi:hypothetical protein
MEAMVAVIQTFLDWYKLRSKVSVTTTDVGISECKIVT